MNEELDSYRAIATFKPPSNRVFNGQKAAQTERLPMDTGTE